MNLETSIENIINAETEDFVELIKLARLAPDDDLQGLDFAELDFYRNDLRKFNFADCDLRGTNLNQADLSGADLSSARGLNQSGIDVANGNRHTTLADGLVKPHHWFDEVDKEYAMTVKPAALILMGLFLLGGCATKKDFVRLDEKAVRLEEKAVGLEEKVVRLEEKIDKLLLATDRSALDSIFEPRAAAIVHNVEKLEGAQRQEFEKLQSAYQKGQMTLYEVREKMVTLLGGGDREVYTPSGIVVRGLGGRRSGVARNGSKLRMCRKLEAHEVPKSIRDNPALRTYSWGVGEREGQQIMFPWEFTISTFTKEIVEPTARRTAQEFIRMGGEDQWSRPIYIKVEGERSENIRVSTDREREIHLMGPDEEVPPR